MYKVIIYQCCIYSTCRCPQVVKKQTDNAGLTYQEHYFSYATSTFTLSTLSVNPTLSTLSDSHLSAQEHTQRYTVYKIAFPCVSRSVEEVVRSNLHQMFPIFTDERNNAVNINNVKQLQLFFFTRLSERDGQWFIQSRRGELSFSHAHLFNMVKGLTQSLHTFWSQVHRRRQHRLCSCGGVTCVCEHVFMIWKNHVAVTKCCLFFD